MTVQEVKNQQKELISTMGEKGFGVVYAFLSHFDIDGDNNIVKNVWWVTDYSYYSEFRKKMCIEVTIVYCSKAEKKESDTLLIV